jgi:arabinofuranosyltransferase
MILPVMGHAAVHRSAGRLDRVDAAVVLGLLLFAILYALMRVDYSLPPAEDAAMLMRYAVHLAEGHGIVWNIGEKPVDGATDFLFMVMVAALIKAGLTPEVAARSLIFVCHVLNVFLIYFSLRFLFSINREIALLPALYLAAATGPLYIVTCFGAPVFALFASITWFFALKLIFIGSSRYTQLAFGLFSLLTGLIRPEGVILTLLMLFSIIIAKGIRESRFSILSWIFFVIILGGFYFLWRWHYFGYPLPNPYYKKGGGILYFSSLIDSYRAIETFGILFIIINAIGMLHSEWRRATFALFVPVIGFATAFILISNEMNIFKRFQYPILPILLMSIYPAYSILKESIFLSDKHVNSKRIFTLYFVLMSILLILSYTRQTMMRNAKLYHDSRRDIGVILSKYKDRNYWIAITEAGLIPFYSGWNAIDTWGLNDQWIAHHGMVTEQYLDQYKPHIIMFHAYFSPIVKEQVANKGNKWDEMVLILQQYAEKRGYILAAVYGETPYDTHYYYVRPDFPDSQNIVKEIRSVKYIWHQSGKQCINFADFTPRKGGAHTVFPTAK